MLVKENCLKGIIPYTGNKFKLLNFIITLFPKNIKSFYDIFAGGLSVPLNVEAERYFINDSCEQLIKMYEYLINQDLSCLINNLESIINHCDFNNTNDIGYAGLKAKYNNDIGENIYYNEQQNIRLFLLICHSFNNQIRFNNKGEFNLPFGKRTFNENLKENLIKAHNKLSDKLIRLSSLDFRTFYLLNRSYEHEENSMHFFDPPYLITIASYNEKNGWNKSDELDLYELLDQLNFRKEKWALSNVVEHKGKTNEILKDWMKRYNVHEINSDYSNCSRFKNKGLTREVLVCNY